MTSGTGLGRGHPVLPSLSSRREVQVRVVARTVTVQHLSGCPNLALACAHVDEAILRYGGPVPEIAVQERPDPATAEHVGFHGSPTILVDGTDPFGDAPAEPTFGRRIYHTRAGPQGTPSLEQILETIGTDTASRAASTPSRPDDGARPHLTGDERLQAGSLGCLGFRHSLGDRRVAAAGIAGVGRRARNGQC